MNACDAAADIASDWSQRNRTDAVTTVAASSLTRPSVMSSMFTLHTEPMTSAMVNAPCRPTYAPTSVRTWTVMFGRRAMTARWARASRMTSGEPMLRLSAASSITAHSSGGSSRSRIACRARRAATREATWSVVAPRCRDSTARL